MSEASAVNGTSNTMCIPAIDQRSYLWGCFGLAVSNGSILFHCFWFYLTSAITGSLYSPQQLAIIVVLSCLKRRNKLKLEYFHVFLKISNVFVFGVMFYPFFACLTTEYKLVGSTLGFLYAAISCCFYYSTYCYFDGERRNELFIGFLSFLPTILCLLFITLRFAVWLILEARRKWFLPTNGNQESAVETDRMCLVSEPAIKHVMHVFNPGLNRDSADAKWYIKLLHYIYKPREGLLN
ncbi:unnamed protein product [Porites evermanni]|uniref:Uncharacterized protein n=1 Tax=Porites evermanni TaxID=104178 RepID=A0ABN8SBC0_9CNID|nr:unnamed protein product [Porites evermanni]